MPGGGYHGKSGATRKPMNLYPSSGLLHAPKALRHMQWAKRHQPPPQSTFTCTPATTGRRRWQTDKKPAGAGLVAAERRRHLALSADRITTSVAPGTAAGFFKKSALFSQKNHSKSKTFLVGYWRWTCLGDLRE